MKKTIIVPGSGASGAPHWAHWWTAVDPTARMVGEVDNSRPDADSWDTAIAAAILLDPGSVLVGHGSGSAAIIRVLRKWPNLKVAGALLVAPIDTPYDRPLRVPSTLVASRNDPDMTFTRASHLAQCLGSGFVDLGFSGQINAECGFGPWPCGIELRDELFCGFWGGVPPGPEMSMASSGIVRLN